MPHFVRPLVLCVLLAACQPASPPPEEAQALLTIATVPPDVACIRITAAGPGRTVEREIGVSPGATISESFSGLPLGTVAFKGEAFPADCASVSKTTVPGWASEPEMVAIVLGKLTTVALTLNRNGRGKVTVDFNGEPVCTVTGGECVAGGACCSKACSKGVCVERDAGPEDGG